MTILHHPDSSTLMSFAAGALPEALSAVVASHAVLCPDCRRSLKVLDMVGGATLARAGEVALSQPLPSPATRGDGATAIKSGKTPGAGKLRAEASDVMGQVLKGDYSGVRWRRLGLGIWHVPLPLSSSARGDLRLFKVAPGVTMPDHGHNGIELSLILSGSYSDKSGTFRAGDLAEMDDEDEHMPVAHSEAGCVCLIASERPARYKGLFARLLQPFVGL